MNLGKQIQRLRALWLIWVGWVLFAWGYGWQKYAYQSTRIFDSPGAIFFLSSPVLLGIIIFRIQRRKDFWQSLLQKHFDDHTASIDAIPASQISFWIALAAGLGLYAELMMIRLHSSYFQLFAYFKNVSLLSCFLGLGIGYALGSKRPLMTAFVLPAMALQILVMHLLRFHESAAILDSPVMEQVSLGLRRIGSISHRMIVYGFLVSFFTLNAMIFVPLGQLASFLMMKKKKLQAYSRNLIGSLLGIFVFSILCFAWMPPAIWILVFSVGLVPFIYKSRAILLASSIASMIVISVLNLHFGSNHIDIYSPYQILTLKFNRSSSTELKVSNVYFQRILDLSTDQVRANSDLKTAASHYELPYQFKPSPEHVLIVGSGTGNDVAAALRMNAGSVDAVEIDPAILKLGETLHPELPYQSSKVRSFVADARAYLGHSGRQYDLIVYGLLDSHTLLSGMSGVRLDSFVYTVEAFRQARSRLKPTGLLSISFSLVGPELGRKLFLMLDEAFDGSPPIVLRTGHDGGFTFLIGESLPQSLNGLPETIVDITDLFSDERIHGDKSTDDWPFFYMPVREYPSSYIVMLVLLAAVSFLMIREFTAESGTGFSPECFFLGAGFMLVETKGITEAALIYGSTWIVVSIMIIFVLLMAFCANWIVIRIGAPKRIFTYALLCASVVLGLWIGPARLNFMPDWMIGPITVSVLALPIFFSGLAFSLELKKATSVPIALSSNLMGAMLGGFIEYNSMYFGLRSLYFLAFALYFFAFISFVPSRYLRKRI